MKNFNIVPHELIKGGFFRYEILVHQKLVMFDGRIDVKKFFFSKSFPFNGRQEVDLELLKSKIYQVGTEIEFANLRGKVIEIKHNIARCEVLLSEADVAAAGEAQFSLAGEYVELMSLDATGAVHAPVIGTQKFRLMLSPVMGVMAKKDVVWPIEEPEKGSDGKV